MKFDKNKLKDDDGIIQYFSGSLHQYDKVRKKNGDVRFRISGRRILPTENMNLRLNQNHWVNFTRMPDAKSTLATNNLISNNSDPYKIKF